MKIAFITKKIIFNFEKLNFEKINSIIYMNNINNKFKFEVLDFASKNTGKIKKKFICTAHGGSNMCPTMKWTKVNDAKSYIITMTDPDAPSGTFVHLILFIKGCCQIGNSSNNITFKFGKNHIGKNEYFGPCAPKGTGKHRYIFRIYAIDFDIETLKGYLEFGEETLKNRIKNNIIQTAEVEFLYEYGSYN